MGRKLYVGKLLHSATESALSDKFAESGTDESVKLIVDFDMGQSKGLAFVSSICGRNERSESSSRNRTIPINGH